MLKIKLRYYFEYYFHKQWYYNQTMITKDENDENVPHLEITEVVLIHCNIFSNDHQQSSRVLHIFVRN